MLLLSFLLSCEKGLIKDRKRRREKEKRERNKDIYIVKERKKERKKDAAAHFVSIIQWLKYILVKASGSRSIPGGYNIFSG